MTTQIRALLTRVEEDAKSKGWLQVVAAAQLAKAELTRLRS